MKKENNELTKLEQVSLAIFVAQIQSRIGEDYNMDSLMNSLMHSSIGIAFDMLSVCSTQERNLLTNIKSLKDNTI